MKTFFSILALLVALAPGLALSADAVQVLGYRIGGATHAEVIASLRERGGQPAERGTSTYSSGPLVGVNAARNLGVEGIKDALLVFDQRRVLTAAQLTVNKNRYDAVVGVLKQKYVLRSEQRPFVGDRRAEFRWGNTLITVDAPHLSFDMTVTYRTLTLQQAMEAAARAEAEAKRRRDQEQF